MPRLTGKSGGRNGKKWVDRYLDVDIIGENVHLSIRDDPRASRPQEAIVLPLRDLRARIDPNRGQLYGPAPGNLGRTDQNKPCQIWAIPSTIQLEIGSGSPWFIEVSWHELEDILSTAP